MEKSDLKCFSYVGNHRICEKSVNSYKWLFLWKGIEIGASQKVEYMFQAFSTSPLGVSATKNPTEVAPDFWGQHMLKIK